MNQMCGAMVIPGHAGHTERVAEILAQKPAMANIQDKDGATPLMFASNKGHCEVHHCLVTKS